MKITFVERSSSTKVSSFFHNRLYINLSYVFYDYLAIHTAAMDMLGGSEVAKQCRKPEICADAAYAILTKDSKSVTGNFFIDDEVSMFID